jgi:hypothetical protein
MTYGNRIETPANKIATAQAVLSLACRLSSEVEAGRINKEIFSREVTIHTGSKGVRIPVFPNGTEEDLKLGISNIVLIALSASALTVDETLNEVFGNLASESDPNKKCIRVMVNQVRNAFAHNPWRPKWLVYPKYRKVYPIELNDRATFEFDARTLDGGSIKPEQVGGLEFWVKLLQHCKESVSL